MKYFRKYPFLAATLASLVLAVGFYLLESGTKLRKAYLESVQNRVDEQVEIAQQDMQQVVEQLKASKPGSENINYLASQHPYYLYRNGRLVMWSDYKLVPAYQDLARHQAPGLIDLPQGQYILLRTTTTHGGKRYDLFSLINLYRRYRTDNSYLQSGFNKKVFSASPRSISGPPFSTSEVIVGPGGKGMFTVEIPETAIYYSHSTSLATISLLLLSSVFFAIHVFFSVLRLRSRYRYGLAFFLLAGYLVVLRALMIAFSIPYVFYGGEVFSPEYYNASRLVPSLGDMLLNAIAAILLLFYVTSIYYRTTCYQWLIHRSEFGKTIFSFLILLLSYGLFYGFYRELSNLYEKSNFTLDITLSISFGSLKIVCLLTFVALSIIYFLLIHLLMGIFLRLNKQVTKGLIIIVVSTLLTWVIAWVLDIWLEWVFLAHTMYLFLLYLMRLPKTFYGFRYSTTIYYFLGAITCALAGTYVVHQEEVIKDILNKKEFGEQLLNENDPYTEFLLKKTNEAIAGDSTIQVILKNKALLSRELIQQKIKSTYLDQYLYKYDVEVVSFDAEGKPLDHQSKALDFAHYQNLFHKSTYSTDFNGIYFVNQPDKGFAKQYISFVKVQQDSTDLGHIVLDLKQTVEMPKNTYPELLLDERFVQAVETRQYSYAIYGPKARRVYSSGTYNYDGKFPLYLLGEGVLFEKGVSLNGYRHVGVVGSSNRKIVVSSKEWAWKGVLANFSFLYLILVVFVAIVIAIHTVRHSFSAMKLTYSTKIQVLLNTVFIFPLLIILFFILRIVYSNYAESQEGMYLNKTYNIASNISEFVSDFQQGKMSKAYLEQKVQQIAHDADLEINVYTTNGNLLLATNPLMYQSGLLANYINPQAFQRIINEKDNLMLLKESLGSKEYNTAYVGLQSNEQNLMGVVGIPYFDSKPDLDRQIIDIVASILMVFTAMLLVFLGVSYFASNLLINPLRVLTRKIGRTNLNQLNEPIDWRSKDEIGLLIKQYNRMLVNLEENKQVLSANEKQSAWREMAKQVAHEIKNPLTPMKLTLQQLQRTIHRDDPQALEKVSRAMESIIEQIDNIGHIAQSFSDIAKMPLPQKDVFEVTSVITKASELYANDHKIILYRDIQKGPIYITGDRKLLGSTISNLIINAKQSVPESRKTIISIKLYTHNDDLLIEIKDNGSGIPKSIHNRVFLPNFTTRAGGSGLGLAMAKRIVEHAGGNIWFETEENSGTTFHLSIPLAEQYSQSYP
ncbi:sensor histidine kinase [Telluribacter humicola]|uniref:sensor histidine kinase n=1 Tax=Telluribacter humicola TaxID=1720261 RepID=UPI001A972AA9|nr:ATP-binding protein [Telluribacter humicola]